MFDLESSIADWRKQMLAEGIQSPVPLDELEIHLRDEIARQMKSGMDAQHAFEFSCSRIGKPEILKREFKKTETALWKRPGVFIALIGAVMILRILTEHLDAAHLRRNEQAEFLFSGSVMVLLGLGTAFFNFNLGASPAVRRWKLVAICYSAFAVWISMVPLASFLTNPKLSPAFSPADWILALTAMAVSGLSLLGWRRVGKILPVIRNPQTRTTIGIACCISGPVAMALFFDFIPRQIGRTPAPLFVVILTWAWTLMVILGGVGYGLTEAAHGKPAVAGS